MEFKKKKLKNVIFKKKLKFKKNFNLKKKILNLKKMFFKSLLKVINYE